jgi:hypothetical protein
MSFLEGRPDTEEEAALFEQLEAVIKRAIDILLSVHRDPEDMAEEIAFEVSRVFEVKLRPQKPRS